MFQEGLRFDVSNSLSSIREVSQWFIFLFCEEVDHRQARLALNLI